MFLHQEAIKTKVIPRDISGYMRHICGAWVSRWWLPLGLTLLVPAALGAIVDPRYYLVTFMIALLCYPTVLLLVFCQHGLRREARRAAYDSVAEITDGEITVTYLPLNDESEPPAATVISFNDITGYNIGHRGISLTWGSGTYNYMMIPHECFPTVEAAKALVGRLRESQR